MFHFSVELFSGVGKRLLGRKKHLNVFLELCWVVGVADPKCGVLQLGVRIILVRPIHLRVSVELVAGGGALLWRWFGLLFRHKVSAKANDAT